MYRILLSDYFKTRLVRQINSLLPNEWYRASHLQTENQAALISFKLVWMNIQTFYVPCAVNWFELIEKIINLNYERDYQIKGNKEKIKTKYLHKRGSTTIGLNYLFRFNKIGSISFLISPSSPHPCTFFFIKKYGQLSELSKEGQREGEIGERGELPVRRVHLRAIIVTLTLLEPMFALKFSKSDFWLRN